MKKRILSGIQPSGQLHIGNYFGMIKRMVDYQESSDLFCFVANLHSLTTLTDPENLKKLTQEAVLDLLALGLNPQKCHFWVQSHVPEVAELAWILSCQAPMGMMERAHSYKDKKSKGLKANLGLFSYPMLMAADILMYHTQVVPVGKDQKQHVEMARDIALKFNHAYGEVFTVPEVEIPQEVATIPGTDGQKMSKSYGNTLPIFAEAKVLKKAVMGIVTDSKAVEDSKDPETCTVFQLYKLFVNPSEQAALAERYKKGGMGYGEAKKLLLETIITYFEPFRKKREYYANQPEEVEKIFKEGAKKVQQVSLKTMKEVRKAVGI